MVGSGQPSLRALVALISGETLGTCGCLSGVSLTERVLEELSRDGKMSSERKSRSARFTPAISEALVQAYRKYEFILQAKFSETVSLEKKKEAYGYVADAVNAVNSGEKKSVEQIKKRWEDMTGNVKKEREARNKELRRLRVTGNGHLEDEEEPNSEPCTESLTPSEKEIAIILGPQTFTGIPGGHDSMETAGENYLCLNLPQEG
ncbi:uncharacterized protein LOC111325246 [Stylophora pistillata]|uniref:uncharacterized protein LOC111325246 n=1 Tax=Stylophora pistillata TaxID=50429 RepID=UPI000C048F3F|nr:uncharacterized protein LOC111325246 [Stylophora pistillata]